VGYVSDLRRLVGSRPLLLPGANVLVVDAHGRVLLQRRADTGEWGVVGGALEIGESSEEAARRELREETGLEAGDLVLLGIVSGGDAGRRVYPNGDVVHAVGAVYAAREVRGELRLQAEELTEVAYFDPGDPPTPMHPFCREALALCATWLAAQASA
jgi:8-oxo-dGTP pyrophosphatase MutT (NUDIX family)